MRSGRWIGMRTGGRALGAAIVVFCLASPEPQVPPPPTPRTLPQPDASSDDERIELPKGIRPPWREPLIPEKRNESPRRKRGWPV